MGTVKQINIKSRTYYFYNDIIDLESFDSSLLKLDKKSHRTLAFTILDILHLGITHSSRYIEEMRVNKYLTFDSVDENKELLKKHNDVFHGIMDKNKEISNDECDYEKDYMKIKFNSDDNLPLNKTLYFHSITITIKSVFKEEGKLYPQVFLDDTLYVLNV